MIIHTTANIDISIKEKIVYASEICGVSKRKIVHYLFKILIKDKPLIFSFFNTVKYQIKKENTDWNCFHLYLSEANYEACLDMRKLMKKSVSFLLAYAVDKYIDRVIEEFHSGTTNNYYDFYLIFTHHSPNNSTFTAFHTFPDPIDYPRYFTDPETYT
jgi:hypothetical protein